VMGPFLIIVSHFNRSITENLLSGALASFRDNGTPAPAVIWVPGAFELPVVAAKAARKKEYEGVICLGCVIRGETPHFDFISQQAAAGLMQVAIETETPVIFGVLTTDTVEQAMARSGINGLNKGAEAANAAISVSKSMKELDVLSLEV
jgi:6,7-dimethyl-8-ribityllumazine synthase